MQSGWELIPLQRYSQPSKRLGLGTQGLGMASSLKVNWECLEDLGKRASEAEAGAASMASKSCWWLLVWYSMLVERKETGQVDSRLPQARPEKQNLQAA